MQLKRSYLRRVNVLKPFIYENCPSSQRAYISIRLAVKTSRPHNTTYFRIKVDYKFTTYFKFKSLIHLFLILTDNLQIKWLAKMICKSLLCIYLTKQ
jgi:hypothetical protein